MMATGRDNNDGCGKGTAGKNNKMVAEKDYIVCSDSRLQKNGPLQQKTNNK